LGIGILRYANGEKYEGTFARDLREGQGRSSDNKEERKRKNIYA